ncbi:hypothetical protein AAG747_10760 [Rapidithrix thailandica]|uniref:Uncharacterized protein n=1 Tax=Rapidithrix thailandica TaxID=413964 RepID=A0AAW9SCD8_9BACT
MRVNRKLMSAVLTIVDNQIIDNHPPETSQTYERLLELGIDKADAKLMIGQAVSVELFHIMKNKQPFNYERFIKNLKKLPEGEMED